MKLVAQNITLENVKNSDYWNLIAILVWDHYSEKEEQDESKIKIEESWFGKSLVLVVVIPINGTTRITQKKVQ